MFKQNMYSRVTMLVAYKVIKYTLSLGFWKKNNSNNKTEDNL